MAVAQHRVVLLSIDGYGLSEEEKGNAIFHARKPCIDALLRTQLHTRLDASGLSVGLPEGLMGNSEVGHLTMGSGRVLYQDLVRINLAIKHDEFGKCCAFSACRYSNCQSSAKNPALQGAFSHAKAHFGRVHFLGLVSDGGVHSHIDHLKALLQQAKKDQVPSSFVHFFADGRGRSVFS